MKTKAIILAVIFGIVFFGVSQTTFAQDEKAITLNKNLTKQVEDTEKILKEIQELKDNVVSKEELKKIASPIDSL